MQPIQEVFEPQAPKSGKWAMVAVVQWAPPSATPMGVTAAAAEAFKQQNREALAAYIRQAAGHGAKMVITSEFGIDGYPAFPNVPPEDDDYRNRQDIAPYVETIPGPTTNYFSALAKELGVYIHVGFAEVDAKTNKYYNVAVAFDPKGAIVGHYRKINLFQAENNFLSPGNQIETYNSPFGKVGMIVCADVYSDFPMKNYASAHVDVMALSTSWDVMNSGWNSFTAGAKWVKAYLLAANQPYFPDSGVINPDGSAQSHIRQTDGLAYGYLPLK
jgi:predicted amidohydrolase